MLLHQNDIQWQVIPAHYLHSLSEDSMVCRPFFVFLSLGKVWGGATVIFQKYQSCTCIWFVYTSYIFFVINYPNKIWHTVDVVRAKTFSLCQPPPQKKHLPKH